MQAKQPLLTVIIPLYNGAATIAAAVNSVLGQTIFSSIELLIMDGLSKDGSQEIIRSLTEGYSNCRLVSEKDEGIYDAMNKGIDLAQGTWLYFMGGDDALYQPDVMEQLFLQTGADADLIYGNVFMEASKRKYDGPFTGTKLLFDNVCHQAIVYRKTLFALKGKYDRKYPLLADYAFNIACFGDVSIRKRYVDIIVANYSETGASNQQRDLIFKKDKNNLIGKAFGTRMHLYATFIVPLKHYYRKWTKATKI